MNKVSEFLKEYRELCRKYNLVIGVNICDSECVRILSNFNDSVGFDILSDRLLEELEKEFALEEKSE